VFPDPSIRRLIGGLEACYADLQTAMQEMFSHQLRQAEGVPVALLGAELPKLLRRKVYGMETDECGQAVNTNAERLREALRPYLRKGGTAS
jgi:hypothetical protein